VTKTREPTVVARRDANHYSTPMSSSSWLPQVLPQRRDS